MNANLCAKVIEMTKAEAKAAGKIGSDKFKELRAYQEAYPNFTIEIKAPAKRKATFSGLTYKYMTNYIQSCKRADKDNIMDEFLKLTTKSQEDEEVAGYLDVKEWFLAKFPEIEQARKARHDEIQKILKAA